MIDALKITPSLRLLRSSLSRAAFRFQIWKETMWHVGHGKGSQKFFLVICFRIYIAWTTWKTPETLAAASQRQRRVPQKFQFLPNWLQSGFMFRKACNHQCLQNLFVCLAQKTNFMYLATFPQVATTEIKQRVWIFSDIIFQTVSFDFTWMYFLHRFSGLYDSPLRKITDINFSLKTLWIQGAHVRKTQPCDLDICAQPYPAHHSS